MKKIVALLALAAPLNLDAMEMKDEAIDNSTSLDSSHSISEASTGKRNQDRSSQVEKGKEETFRDLSLSSPKRIKKDEIPNLEDFEGAAIAPITILPLEILAQILSVTDAKELLTIAAVVCRSWNELIQTDYIWSLKLKQQNTPLPPDCEKFWNSAKTIYLFHQMPRNLIEGLILKTFGNYSVVDYADPAVNSIYGEKLVEHAAGVDYRQGGAESEHEKIKEAPFLREDLEHLLCSPDLLSQLYGNDYLIFYQDLQAWQVYTDTLRHLLTVYHLIITEFKEPLEKGIWESYYYERYLQSHPDDDRLTFDLSYYPKLHGGFKLKTLPKHMLLLRPVMEALYISDQALTEIPEELIQSPNMKLLSLNGNQIKQVPDSLFSMPKLEWLWLKKNQIESVGDNLEQFSANLPRFNYLGLSHNPLEAISAPLIERTDHLVLNNCQLSFLPTADYSKLEVLCLKNNTLKTLPRELHQAKRLYRLDLEGNHLPKSLLPEGATNFNFDQRKIGQNFSDKFSLIQEFLRADW